MIDGQQEIIPAGTLPGAAQPKTFYINDESGKIRAPLYEGYHPIGQLEFEANCSPGTAVDLRTIYEIGRLEVEITIAGNKPQMKPIELQPTNIKGQLQSLANDFHTLQENTNRLLNNLPKEGKYFNTLRQEWEILITDLRIEFENQIVPDIARIDDRLRQLTNLEWNIKRFSSTKEGLELRIEYIRSAITSQENVQPFLEKLNQFENKLKNAQENHFAALDAEMLEIEHAIRTRLVVITDEHVRLMKQEVSDKIERIRMFSVKDQKTQEHLNKVEERMNAIYSKHSGNPALLYNRLWELDYEFLREVYHDTVIKRDQEGLLRLQA